MFEILVGPMMDLKALAAPASLAAEFCVEQSPKPALIPFTRVHISIVLITQYLHRLKGGLGIGDLPGFFGLLRRARADERIVLSTQCSNLEFEIIRILNDQIAQLFAK
jgi:hypothetical protein